MPESSEVKNKPEFQDCLSCRIWTGTFHIGAAAFVASQWRKQTHLASKAFVLTFSAGLGIIGITRLLNLSLFSKSSMNLQNKSK